MKFQYDDTPYFYQYQPPTPSKDIARELMDLELQTDRRIVEMHFEGIM